MILKCIWLFLVIGSYGIVSAKSLLGTKECTWGPSFWCNNLGNAKGCGAVTHCIKAVWEKQTYPKDDDNVCQICLDMVKQARDQLESNQTQEDLMAVFEGSCRLIAVEIISKECVKLVDEFIPELVETLASQMNPQTVCSVAGLCNNARYDKILKDADMLKKPETSIAPVASQKCNGCYTVVGLMKNKFNALSYEDFLTSVLKVCFKLGSFSDSCAATVFKYYENIYSTMKNQFNADNVCHVAGTCTERFHQHKPEEKGTTDVEITPMGDVGMVRVGKGDDVPCELCEQLVSHLRDILIANTTEAEFKRVMQGLCKQTGEFKDECLALVDQFYAQIYTFMVNELDPNALCSMAGMCGKQNGLMDVPIAPLLPPKTAELAIKVIKPHKDQKLVGDDETNSYKLPRVSIGNTQSSVKVMKPELSQLPIDRMMVQLPLNKELCIFCQYFLHFLQNEISKPSTEENIKEVVEGACDKLPTSISSECKAFVEAYGNAVIALLIQEIDPSQVCPKLTLCPQEGAVSNVEILMTSGNKDQPTCPLCLFAVEQLEAMLKNNKTQESIQHALDNLCSHLPDKLKAECVDFVDTYSKQLFEMLVADFTPQEVCVYLHLCNDSQPGVSSLKPTVSLTDKFHSQKGLMADHNNFKKPMLPKEMLENTGEFAQIETNEIFDNTYNGKPLIYADVSPNKATASPQCVICEFIMTQIDKELADQATDDQIKKVVHTICNHLPTDVGKECNDFVNQYADVIIDLLVKELSPADVCQVIHMCGNKAMAIKNAVLECAVCEEAVDMVEQILSNPNVDKKIEHVIEKTCYALPGRYLNRCLKIMQSYAISIVHLVSTLADSGKVCSKIGLCGENDYTSVKMDPPIDGNNKCNSGPSYWCESKENALKCDTLEYCQKVWGGQHPPKRLRRSTPLLGAEKCTWGPGYWCENLNQATECNALEHCRKNVWKAPAPLRKQRQTPLDGFNKCTWGPEYWCENLKQAIECNALEHCREKVWNAPTPVRKRRDRPLLGAKKCTWGPAYWCANIDQANECNALEHCRQNVWKAPAPLRRRRDKPLIGANKCTWGPGYWCENLDQANECGALEHCRSKVWLANSP